MLTDDFCHDAAVLPGAKISKFYDHGGVAGLHLRVAGGTKNWHFAYRYNNKPNVISLGRFPDVTLDAAREGARAAQCICDEGLDPSAVKRSRLRTMLDEANQEVRNALNAIAKLHPNVQQEVFKKRGNISFIASEAKMRLSSARHRVWQLKKAAP